MPAEASDWVWASRPALARVLGCWGRCDPSWRLQRHQEPLPTRLSPPRFVLWTNSRCRSLIGPRSGLSKSLMFVPGPMSQLCPFQFAGVVSMMVRIITQLGAGGSAPVWVSAVRAGFTQRAGRQIGVLPEHLRALGGARRNHPIRRMEHARRSPNTILYTSLRDDQNLRPRYPIGKCPQRCSAAPRARHSAAIPLNSPRRGGGSSWRASSGQRSTRSRQRGRLAGRLGGPSCGIPQTHVTSTELQRMERSPTRSVWSFQ
jgi:hypothetical protein